MFAVFSQVADSTDWAIAPTSAAGFFATRDHAEMELEGVKFQRAGKIGKLCVAEVGKETVDHVYELGHAEFAFVITDGVAHYMPADTESPDFD